MILTLFNIVQYDEVNPFFYFIHLMVLTAEREI